MLLSTRLLGGSQSQLHSGDFFYFSAGKCDFDFDLSAQVVVMIMFLLFSSFDSVLVYLLYIICIIGSILSFLPLIHTLGLSLQLPCEYSLAFDSFLLKFIKSVKSLFTVAIKHSSQNMSRYLISLEIFRLKYFATGGLNPSLQLSVMSLVHFLQSSIYTDMNIRLDFRGGRVGRLYGS